MSLDLTELTRIGHALEEARSLLEADCARLEKQYGPSPHGDVSAGSPEQTLRGIREMSSGVSGALERVVLAAGYSALGFHHRADRKLQSARMKPASVPSGADRMARPLGEATTRALELIRDLDFFPDETALAIDVALAAPQATYPPADWDAYAREQQWRSQSDRP
ncbi:hypothetical protein [Streptomyces qinzhouensis]|uniref:Uncharacterized protein n=1 Tax=Streptomyces qinzhouensis TaxID=2599401 RepID=A0A5B8JEW2_9ACTN|nr:hypothetical protein [Streptomyces qinzhouensis]QDY80157.1 hypothetical protein FQU76_30715 [Streptomyces qinzhouensis]